MEEIIKISIIESSLDTMTDFKEHLVEKKKSTTYSGSYRQYSPTRLPEDDNRTIYFYEFSNMNSSPKIFNKVSEFRSWSSKYNLWISEYSLSELRSHEKNYITCYPGGTTCTIAHDYNELKTRIENYTAYNSNYSYSKKYDDRYYDWD